MTVLEKVKAAAAKLDPDEQFDLFRWWITTDAFKDRQVAALKQDLQAGLDQLADGRYQTYNDSSLLQLAEDIGHMGRERLKKRKA